MKTLRNKKGYKKVKMTSLVLILWKVSLQITFWNSKNKKENGVKIKINSI